MSLLGGKKIRGQLLNSKDPIPRNFNLRPNSLASQQFNSLTPEKNSMDYKDEVISLILDQINMAVAQISTSGSPSIVELYTELELRGFDTNNRYIKKVLELMFDTVNILEHYKEYKNMLSLAISSGNSSIEYRVHRLKYNENLIMATDGIENGAVFSNLAQFCIDYRKLIPVLLRDGKARAELAEKGGRKNDDLQVIIPVTITLLEWLISTSGN